MLSRRAYYALKPLIPWETRMWLRRRFAAGRRRASSLVWPVDPKAATVPPNWPGWPDGKRFAVVLTHDVEGEKGFSRVGNLMDLEQRNGFRSSFNFVPESEYCVSDSLREELDRKGFEIGIHGLEHDGKLYSSKADFARKAARIREYAKLWNACGFRSPFMQHRLNWLHELGFEYDASTFDTDPFEPQPDAAETIFPFWVPGANGEGYVELPYTLVQDFTLFVILREPNADVWKRKVDWIAEHGGMVLVNTHPDYKCFSGQPSKDEFPAQHYEDLLQYVRDTYEGSFWHALPRDVARYYRKSVSPALRNTRRKVCMVAYTDYESDNRVRRYAETLVSRGDQVDIISLEHGNKPLGSSTVAGVCVNRIQRRKVDEKGAGDYLWRLMRFLLASSVELTRLHRFRRYDAVHVHNMPDFLVFSAWYPKMTGAKIVLDIHDIVPELYASKFGTGEQSLTCKVLRVIEKTSAGFADHVIVSNDLWYKTLTARSVESHKSSVLLNHVDRSIFYRHPRIRHNDKFVILFPGGFQWHQGLDIAIKALARVRMVAPNVELHLYGGGPEANALRTLSEGLGLNGSVKFCGSVSLDRMPGVMADCDLGVVPKRANSFGNEAYSTKILEFMSQGVPVVASRTKIDSFYFDDTVLRFFESGNDEALACAIIELIRKPEMRQSLGENGFKFAAQNSWENKKSEYFSLVDSLLTETFRNECEPAAR